MKLPAALYCGILFAALAAASATAGEAEEANVAAAPLEPLFPDSEDEEQRMMVGISSEMRRDNVFARLAASFTNRDRDRDLEITGLRRTPDRRGGSNAVPSDGDEDRDLESESDLAEELDSEDFNYFGVPMP
uniref:RxLR effector protein n=1 Tax=Minutocellus polymorphus TaxID=265543 RepID=A0A7S0FN54_9STRA|mmetsp:Transcript_2285/g.3828  ORF Transcript_2285/g.3828 Transcript_2285/m.3828 type:complete len:132 (+) Transcript_2285:91-486(+)|eukprot:CAMPEP_0197720044 /NCGR_PEP_ID=MMETSP1434-20131217/3535_1 /TAXON_ID=265543 /ORGANISM="Minutocellus polymorphus, Strain CCMP3303" /LENGTH=131 /DNA_ID=CAMNT_0043304843 /DNA_START=99 /DNA_END=494 /DNA_ORIENTATION=+